MKLRTGIILSIVACLFSGCKFLPEVSEVRLSESSITLHVNQSKTIIATVEPAAAEYESITWSSSDPSVASVSSSGKIVAVKIGTAEITASAAGVTSKPCTVTVEATHVTGVSLSKTSIQLTEGESATLVATVSPSDATDPSVRWSSDYANVASVDNGRITAKAPGTAVITVRTNDGNKVATCSVEVKAKVISVTGVSLSQSTLSLVEGDTYQLEATVSPSDATNKEVTWSSDNTSVATVSTNGVITAKSAGSAKITVKTKDQGKTATCSVTVKAKTVAVTGVSLDKSSMSLVVGNTGSLTATVSPSNASNKNVTWSSSNTSVATVSTSGVVTAKAAGSTTITVKTNDGNNTATCSVTVSSQEEIITIPDASFKSYLVSYSSYYNSDGNLVSYYDTNGDGEISKTEALKITSLYVSKLGISSLTGIEMMLNLNYLDCHSNQLTSLDLSKNTALTQLYCYSNQLTSLDVSKNTALARLYCEYNQLTTLDVSKNTALNTLNCYSNQLTSLDVSKNTALIQLRCYSNQLTTLDVSKNTALAYLVCNPMNNNSLKFLYMATGQSITLDVPSYTQIIRK